MIHYSCDRCNRLIETDDELRYVVDVEVRASFGDDDRTDERHVSHLFEVDALDETSDDEFDEVCSQQRFDLCSECYAAFRSNPLGREVVKPMGFSEN